MTVPAPAPPGGAWISIKTLALRIPSIVRKALFRIIFDCCGNIWIIRGEGELHFNFAIIDLDRLHQSE